MSWVRGSCSRNVSATGTRLLTSIVVAFCKEYIRLHSLDFLNVYDCHDLKKLSCSDKDTMQVGTSGTHYTINGHNFAKDDTTQHHFNTALNIRSKGTWTYLIKFFVDIRGALTPPPRIEEPVTKIPLKRTIVNIYQGKGGFSHQGE